MDSLEGEIYGSERENAEGPVRRTAFSVYLYNCPRYLPYLYFLVQCLLLTRVLRASLPSFGAIPILLSPLRPFLLMGEMDIQFLESGRELARGPDEVAGHALGQQAVLVGVVIVWER